MKIDKLVLLSVALCAIVLAGELMAYGPNMHNYGADVEFGEGTAAVRVTSSGPNAYSAVVLDNGTHPAVTQLYIYFDERYGESFGEVRDAIGLRGIDMGYAVDQIRRTLGVRGFSDVLVCNDEQLLEVMQGDAAGAASKGLLVMSYALPESIYSGADDSLLMEWVRHGGSLYWMMSPIGMFCRGESGIVAVENSQETLFGRECVNMSGTDLALSVADGGGLTDALYLTWNRTIYGLDTSGMAGAFTMGFSQDGYSSVSMVPFGDGMICVFGGNSSRYLIDDAAQIIASGASCYSKVLEIRYGTVARGTAEFSLDIPEGTGEVSIYVSIGGYYTVSGRSFRC